MDFASLEGSLQTKEMARLLGAESQYPAMGFEACGSRGEAANDARVGNRYNWHVSISNLK